MFPNQFSYIKAKREKIILNSTFYPSFDNPDSYEQRLKNIEMESVNPLMQSISNSVKEKFAQYRVESEDQRKRMFPKKDSPFVKNENTN